MDKKDIKIGILNDYYGGLLTKYQSEIVRLYFDCDLSLSEIGEEYGVSRQAVSEIVSRAQKKLLEYEKKLGLAQKINGLRADIEELIKLDDTDAVKTGLTRILKEVREI